MELIEKEHRYKMEHFDANRQQLHRVRESVQLQRSAINQNKYIMAAKRRKDTH